MRRKEFFEITSLCRDDVAEICETPEQILLARNLTNDEMKSIAKRMANILLDEAFWCSLRVAFETEMEMKKELNKNAILF